MLIKAIKTKTIVTCILVTFCSALLASCVSVSKPLEKEANYNPKKAYVYGRFIATEDSNKQLIYSIVLLDINAEEDSLDPTNEAAKKYIAFNDNHNVKLLELNPGQYNINQVNILKKDIIGANPIAQDRHMFKFTDPIVLNLEAGQAYYLGDYEGSIKSSTSHSYRGYSIRYSWALENIENQYENASTQLKRNFLSFKNIATTNSLITVIAEALKQ